MRRDRPEALRSLHTRADEYMGRGYSVSPSALQAPRIAISANLSEVGSALSLAYSESIIKAGGIPSIIPVTDRVEVLLPLLQDADALLLSGGADIDPKFLDEDPVRGLGEVKPLRDRCEFMLIYLARLLALPILGICRGHQILGVAYGSTLFQDLESQYTIEGVLDHNPRMPKEEGAHRIALTDPRSRLASILGLDGDEELYVNSIHHQALREVRPPFREEAMARDGVNEAIDAYPEIDILGVQWHPEQMVYGASDDRQQRLFIDLVERAELYRQAKRVHERIISLDSHTDTPMCFSPSFDIARSVHSLVDLSSMELGQIDASVMVAYLPQGAIDEDGHKEAFTLAVDKLSELHRQVALYPRRVAIATSIEDLERNKALGLRSIVPAIENGYALHDKIERLQYFRDGYGVVYITLCHNGDNLICDSARKSVRTHGGLSPYGKEVVREMNRLGMLIDLSHSSSDTVRDVLALSTSPVVASHSSVRSLCDHPRNLTDDEIKSIASKGGVVQVCLYAGFINSQEEEASLMDAVDHIEHIVRIAGVRHVGIGSDFDGDGELIGLRSTTDLKRITIELLRRGYDEEDIALIWGGNFMRVLDACQRMAEVPWSGRPFVGLGASHPEL